MSARHLDIAKEVVLALIAKARPSARIEAILPGVVLAVGVIARTLREVEEQEYGQLCDLAPQVPDRKPRAKPYRPEGAEVLPKPKIPGLVVRSSKHGRKAAA